MKSAGESDSVKHKVSELQRAKFSREMNSVVNIENAGRDEQMYKKVCEILDSDEDVVNPIGRLMDKSCYSGLDDGGKQRYILELSKKFNDLKERYYKERLGKTC